MAVTITVNGAPGPLLDRYPASPAETITLAVVDPTEVYSYAWTLVSIPDGSTAVLSDPVAVSPTFDLDLIGTYHVRLVATLMSGGTATDDTIVGVLHPRIPVRFPAFGETLQAGTRGWAATREDNIRMLSDLLNTGSAFPCFNRSGGAITYGSVVKIVGWEDVPLGGGVVCKMAQVEYASSADTTDNVFGFLPVLSDAMVGTDVADNGRWYIVVHGPVWGVRAAGVLTAGQVISRTATPGEVDVGTSAPIGYGIGGTEVYVGAPAGLGGGSGGGGGGLLQETAAGTLNIFLPPFQYHNGSEYVPVGARYVNAGVYGTMFGVSIPIGAGGPLPILEGQARIDYLSITKADGTLVQRFGAGVDYGDGLVAAHSIPGVGELAPDGRAFAVRFVAPGLVALTLESVAFKATTATMNTIEVAACEDAGGVPNLGTLVVLGTVLTSSDPLFPDYGILHGASYPVTGNFWLLILFGGAMPEPGRTMCGNVLVPDFIKSGWSWDNHLYTDDMGVHTFAFAGGIEGYDMEVMFSDTPSVPAYPAADPLYTDIAKLGTPAYPLCRWDGGRNTERMLVVSESEAVAGGFAFNEAPVVWIGT